MIVWWKKTLISMVNICSSMKWVQNINNCDLKKVKSSKPTWLGLTDYAIFLLSERNPQKL